MPPNSQEHPSRGSSHAGVAETFALEPGNSDLGECSPHPTLVAPHTDSLLKPNANDPVIMLTAQQVAPACNDPATAIVEPSPNDTNPKITLNGSQGQLIRFALMLKSILHTLQF